MRRIPLIAILFLGIAFNGIAQDSVKKVTIPAKPVQKYKTYKYVNPKVVPPVTTPAGQPAAAPKPDTAAPKPPVVFDKSLNGQCQYLLSKVYHYQQPLISALWKSALDTLTLNKHKLQNAEGRLNTQKKVIDSLNAEISTKNQNLSASNARVDAVNVFGMFVDKSVYNLIMWGLVAVFGITTAIVIARSGGYSREAKYRIKLYNELEEEFKTYKAKANEKEKKLARELQTERNKNDELLGRG